MKWSQFFIPTLKETPQGIEAISHKLLLRAGLVHMLTSGVYSYLPFGLKVLKNIENIIRAEMNEAGAIELFLPCLHPIDLWKQTGRDEVLKDVMIKFQDGKNRAMCLGPTHEEVITDLVKNFVQSYRQLPINLYQIQTKFRDELRPRFGIVRACEFIMKDAYSFDKDMAGLEKSYESMRQAYLKIFKKLDLDVVVVSADSGAMGGGLSHEFMVPAPIGEDSTFVCTSCDFRGGEDETMKEGGVCNACGKGTLEKQQTIELGHIFQLLTKYSKAQQAVFLDEDGTQKPVLMGCYGIGVSRVIAAIIETHNDDKGIIWPEAVAPFDIEILPIEGKKDEGHEVKELTNRYYKELMALGYDVLVDDRNESAGKKFNDADLIGLPLRVTVGQRNLKEGNVELKVRKTQEVFFVDKEKAIMRIKELLNKHD